MQLKKVINKLSRFRFFKLNEIQIKLDKNRNIILE